MANYLRTMVYNSRILALLLALCISVLVTLFLSLVDDVSNTTLTVSVISSFAISYLLIYIVLEFLIFREIRLIYKLINKLKKKELDARADQKSALNPLKTINAEIFSLAEYQQKEIDELRKLEAFRKEFIADISHELKTPIFAAQGFVHTLLDGAVHDKSVRIKFLKKAAKSLDGLDMLVQDLLTLSHIETGQIKMQFDNFDLYQLTEEIFEQFESKAEKREIDLKIDSDRRKIVVYADRQRIRQVLTNLVSNAINHSFDSGKVIVSFAPTKKNFIIKVIDSGEGIPEEHISRIFERFYRVDKSRSREKGGTGLGLAIVKHILEGHNAKAEVVSAPGKGSTFSFKLPKGKMNIEETEI